jgi:hypothetical protein
MCDLWSCFPVLYHGLQDFADGDWRKANDSSRREDGGFNSGTKGRVVMIFVADPHKIMNFIAG